MWLLGTSPRGPSIFVPQGRGRPSPSSATPGVLGCCPSPHLPPGPTPPALPHTSLVPPPRQETRTGFCALPLMPGTTAEPLPPLPGTTCPPGPMVGCSHHPVCAPAMPHPVTQPSSACDEGTTGLGGQATSMGTSPASPQPLLHPCGREPKRGPVPPVMLGPGFSRSHTWSLEGVAHVVGATVPSLLRPPNSVSLSPGWGVWVCGPSRHSPVLWSDPSGGSHPSQGQQLGDHGDRAPQQRGHPGAAATLPCPGPTRQLQCSSGSFAMRLFLTLQPNFTLLAQLSV